MASAPQPRRKPAGFFRVILPCIPYQKKMDLPLKFVMKYGAQLSSTATFNLPDATVWKIGVKKAADGRAASFTTNWDRFVEHYSISVGFFVVFKYLGSSEFNVKIFNLTTCSIAYPSISPNQAVISENEEEEEDRVKVKGEVEKLLNRVKESGIIKGLKFDRILFENWEKSKKGVEEAVLFKPPNRACFLTVITSALIRGNSMVAIPSPFATEYVDGGWPSVKLRVQGEKKWDVSLRRAEKMQTIYMVGNGWKRFMKDNGLGVGDVCLFQLVSPASRVLEVAVFPAE